MTKLEKIASLLDRPCTLEGGVYRCIEGLAPADSAGKGLAGRLQAALKRRPGLYRFLVETFSPVLVSRAMRRGLARTLAAHGPDAAVVNLGSGPLGLPGRPDLINVDIAAFERVDVCADATDLPFRSGSVDCLVNLAMLEHVADADRVAAEMERVLRPGGEFFCFVPFMQPLHAAPSDFRRWTADGARGLFGALEVRQVGVGAGPTSGWLWVTVEWLALALSFGNATLRDCLALALMLILFPVKHLDRLLEGRPGAERIASGFFVAGRKTAPAHPETP